MKIKQFFVPATILSAPEEAQRVRLLYIILACIEISLAIYISVLLIVARQHIDRLYVVGPAVPLLIGVYLLVKRRQTRLAELVLVWLLWILISVSAFTTGGVHSPSFFVYTIPILLAGLLIERQAGIAFAAASALVGLLMLWGTEQAVILSPDTPLNNPILRWLIGSLAFGATAILQYLEVSRLSEALTEAQLKERALAESNSTLRERTLKLEQSESALRQSEAHLRTLIQALPDAIIRVRGDGTILDVKRPIDFVMSVPLEQLVGLKIQDCLPPPLAEQLFHMNRQALQTKTIQIKEYSVVVAGETHWRESRALALGDNEVIAIVRDITKRKRALEVLYQSEERYRKLVELSPDAILIYRERRVLFANPAGLRLWGANELNEIIGRSYTALTHPTAHRAEQAWQEAVLDRDTIIPIREEKIARLDGGIVDVEVAAVAYQDQDGVAVQAIYRDVTERKQNEEKSQHLLHEVEAQRSQLRAVNLRLAKLEENERKRLAHELHDGVAQNLTGLNLNLNVLLRHLQNELPAESRAYPRLKDAITLVEQTTMQIRTIMSDLRPPVLDDYGLLAALEWYAAQIRFKNDLQIEVLGEDLAPRPAEYVELTLFRIAQEALLNVIKHAQATQVMVVLTSDNQTIYVSISDDGMGIEPAQQEHSAQQQSWGLITMRERAEAIGGCCQIESYPFLGTAVMVEVEHEYQGVVSG